MQKLGLFPLNAVLFPGMPLTLHIFEPRYRKLMRTCIDHSRNFGVVMIRSGLEALGPPAVPFTTGCSARIGYVDNLPDGRMNITVVGEERFRIQQLDHSQDYLAGEVEQWPLENPHALDVLRGSHRLTVNVRHYLKGLSVISQEDPDLSAIELPEDPHAFLYLAAYLLQIPVIEKQPLLEAPTASDLLENLARLYRREIALMHPPPSFDEDAARRSSWLN